MIPKLNLGFGEMRFFIYTFLFKKKKQQQKNNPSPGDINSMNLPGLTSRNSSSNLGQNPSPGDINSMNLPGLTSQNSSSNLGQWFRRWQFKVDSIFSSGGHFVEQSGTECSFSVKHIKMRIICVKLNLDQ